MRKMRPEQWDELMRRLNSGGCPVLRDSGYRVSARGLTIQLAPGMNYSRVFDLAKGGTGFAFDILLRNDLDRPLDIEGFRLMCPWGIQKVSLVAPENKSCPKDSSYVLLDDALYFDGEYVINYLFARRKSRLAPQEEIQGMFFGTSKEPIPAEIQNLSRAFVTFTVFDTRGNQYEARFNILVERRMLAKVCWTNTQPVL